MTIEQILQHWLKYSEYDPEQKSFNLLSANYQFHKICDNMKKIMAFDPSGVIAVLYAKKKFIELCKDTRTTLADVFETPGDFADDKAMWDIFHGEDIAAAEDALLEKIDAVVSQVVPTKLLGERDKDAERKTLYGNVETVVEEMTGLHEDLFLRGSAIGPVTHFSTHIHVFDSLAQCLLAMENARDGMYLCYVNSNGTADGNFGFYIKSNGTILSVNERVNESYPGQHKNTRNGRWQDAKKDNLFPYHHIFEYMDHDYKGYHGKQVIDEEKLAFFTLGASVYMPLLISMVLLSGKYAGADISDMELKYVDSLLPKNIALPTPGTQALIVPNESAIVTVNAEYKTTLTTEDITENRFAEKYRFASKRSEETTDAELFARLYGEGFVLDTDALLVTNPELKALPADKLATTDITPNCEFVGTKERMDIIAYQQGRAQFAAHIRKQMRGEFERFCGDDAAKAFGGIAAARKWLRDSVLKNSDYLFSLCAQKYLAVKNDEEDNIGEGYIDCSNNRLRFISFEEDAPAQGCNGENYPLNVPKRNNDRRGTNTGKWFCPITGSIASTYFYFRPNNWRELEALFGKGSVPKAIMGWRRDGHYTSGNSLLSVTDPVTGIGTLLEAHETGSYYSADFRFYIGFSKRGLKELLKKHEHIQTQGKETPSP